ncbi:hypothetical protein [Actinomyces qiguomingii]|uniref:carboxylate--amine ligase n=1 Tax=Actinomyces qiguomingii TaxID=2057800 RepID=UPI000CA036F5|nr:hypothetical protein [Actinomyces qiguomingii]
MKKFQPVIVGGDIGAYALARQLNDAYGVVPVLVTKYDPLAIRDSAIVTRHQCDRADDAAGLVADLEALGARLSADNPGVPLLLLANTDWRIRVLAEHRDRLERFYLVPIPQLETIDLVSDKERFARVAAEQNLPVPRSHYQDFSGADAPDWAPVPLPEDFFFPLVAKPADSAAYETLIFEGRKKVYFIQDAVELEELWRTLVAAGFRSRFVVQQLVPGDDTAMYSLTAYVDSQGRMSMGVAARVLLEEHAPATLGNPCAMITFDAPDLLAAAERFLAATGYRGFANFDIKRDPRTGEFYFLEVNPRIGRNSFYCVGAGVNPMEVLVADVVEEQPIEPGRYTAACLYTLVPRRLLDRYVRDEALRRRVGELRRSGRVINPLNNPRDASPRRRLYRLAGELSQWRKFRNHYPVPTDTGF